jgi:hypothetical protein
MSKGPRSYLLLDGCQSELHIRAVECAHADIGQGELLDDKGRGTNRSPYVDGVNRRFGSPLGSFWCGNAVGGWWQDAGAALPPVPGDCDSWLAWAFKTNRFRTKPHPGYAALYGTMKDASHIELVSRTMRDPTSAWSLRTQVIGGNCSLGAFTRDGWVVAQRSVNMERLIGFVAMLPGDP